MLTINDKISIPIREFEFKFSRSPGPGGQNVNKLNTKVTLRWNLNKSRSISETVKQRIRKNYSRRINKQGEMLISSHRFRDQGRNVADAMNKLRELILEATEVPKVRKKTRPTRASQRKRLENKKRISDKKRSRRSPNRDL